MNIGINQRVLETVHQLNFGFNNGVAIIIRVPHSPESLKKFQS